MPVSALILALALFLGAAAGARAQGNPALDAKSAALALEQAALALQDARKARDRVAALTQTVKAFEKGLGALRDGMRQAAIREDALQQELDTRRAEISRLTGVLLSMQRAPETLLLLHPSGPVDTARSGMILTDVTPALQLQTEQLRADLQELAVLQSLQAGARDTVAEGLRGAQEARVALSQAISNRETLPPRFSADPVAMAILLDSAQTLESFAAGLAQIDGPRHFDDLPPFQTLRGRLPLPVQGRILRRFDEADAAGIRRPGLLLATRPQALVTTPAPGTIRYLGPLLDYGNVIILEPANGYLMVLAGLAEVYGTVGQVVPAGGPLGLMPGGDHNIAAFLAEPAEGGSTERSETLYIELRKGGTPIDPGPWFGPDKE